jgi:mRNA interferase MazF
LRRGEIWTLADSGDYTDKPRPVLIVQDDSFDATDSIIVCGLTTTPIDAPLLRIPVAPVVDNGLRASCWIMADKITAVRRRRLGHLIGRVDRRTIRQLNRSLFVFLGLGQTTT